MVDFPPEVVDLTKFRRDKDGPSAAEGLSLIEAFLKIKNPSLRKTIIELVEKISAESA